MSEADALPGVFVSKPPDSAHTIVGVSTAETAFVGVFAQGPLNEAIRVSSFGEFEASFGGLDARSESSYAVKQYFENGGQVAWIVRTQDAAAVSLIGDEALGTGMYALDRIAPSVFNLLCIPAAANLPDGNSVIAAAEDFCRRKRALFIADIPQYVTTPGAMQTWKSTQSGSWESSATVYFPRLVVVDPLNPVQPRNIVSSGAIAGMYARFDASQGVWKSPAGLDARIVGAEPAVNVFDAQIAALNAAGINALRSLPPVGVVAWGARTMAGVNADASEWKYVAVRRTALFLEESLVEGLQWVVFEPNDESLWQSIRLTVSAFIHNLFLQGAFQGAKPEDAYFVKCDRTTITQNDLDQGVVNVVVGFAPLKPAEFVLIRISQFAGQTG